MPSNNQSYVEVEDIETGERVVSASNSHSSTRKAGNGAMLHAEATVVVSDELREETKKRDAEMLLMQAKLASKNLGETLRKKAESENKTRPYTLYDFMDIQNVKRCNFKELDLNKLRKLYMIKTKNVKSLLFLCQTKNEDLFDRINYSSIMLQAYNLVYVLPMTDISDKSKITEENELSEYPLDELFMWSLLLYSGQESELDLIKYYWSICTRPLACAMGAILVYSRFQKMNFVTEELRAKLGKAKKEFEKNAFDLFDTCYDEHQALTEDLILNCNETFYNRTVIDMAIEADARGLVRHKGIQKLLTAVWYEKINSETSKWKLFWCCIFLPFTLLPWKFYRTDFLLEETEEEKDDGGADLNKYEDSTKALLAKVALPPNCPNEDLPFRTDDDEPHWLGRPFHFLHAPCIKFVHHLVYHILYLGTFCYVLLFGFFAPYTLEAGVRDNEIRLALGDYGYFRLKYTECVLVFWNTLQLIEFIRQMFLGDSLDGRIVTRIKNHLKQAWNLYEISVFIVFYTGVLFRLYPSVKNYCIAWDERCMEIGRVLYCIALMMGFFKTVRFLEVLPELGIKLLLLKETIKQLLIFVVLLVLIIVPYSVALKTIISGSQLYKTRILTESLNFVIWPLFGNLADVLKAIGDYECPPDKNVCVYGVRTTFLYLSFGFYIIFCNLLIFNMIIAVFSVKVADVTDETNKAYSFKRYLFIKTYSRMTVLPAPLACVEYILRFLRYPVNYCNGNKFESYEAFAIRDIDDVVRREYLRFEEACQKKLFTRTDLDADPDYASSDGRTSGTLNKKSFKSQGQNKGFNQVFDSIEKATVKNEWEKNFKAVEARVNIVQTMVEKLQQKMHSNNSSSTKTMDSLKSSIDYLSHFLITKDIDMKQREEQVVQAQTKPPIQNNRKR